MNSNEKQLSDFTSFQLDLFSTTPEMIEVPVSEIVQRWTPQTDLSPLINIRNKYFYQTNVLGESLIDISHAFHFISSSI